MCGVAGIYAYHAAAAPADRGELRAMRDHMQARGPDGAGEWLSPDGRAALAHRRLSIIDLSERAAQPMASEDGQLVISFNGEIYNHVQLRRELETRGRRFRTASDTEVLLQLYAEHGTAMLDKLRGMFAFALWDERKRALLLARDPFGIKPLYLADDGWSVRVASQVKALLRSPAVSRAPELAGQAGFYLFGCVPEPFTLYQQIRSVPAGCYQWIDPTGPRPAVAYFDCAALWSTASGGEPAVPDDRESLQRIVRQALQDSVRHHLVSDVPVGAFLSAGIDSGALVGLMKDVGQQHVQTITIAFQEFEGTADDESTLAAEVARAYGVRNSRRLVTEGEFAADLPAILAAMDQPSIDGVNTWFVSKAASQAGLKVAISGLGGDELFGGYPSFTDIPRWIRAMWLPARLPGLGRLAEQVQAAFPGLLAGLSPKAGSLVRYGGTLAGAYLVRRGLHMPAELPALMGPDAAREGLRRLRPLQRLRQLAAPARPTEYGRIASLEATHYMRNQLLRDTDWASMAHSLEVRTPLVDATLWRALAHPLLAARERDGKRVLAAAPATPLPAAVTARRKTGFSTPVSLWQQRHGPATGGKATPWARTWGRRVMASAGWQV